VELVHQEHPVQLAHQEVQVKQVELVHQEHQGQDSTQ
jgi:hypothetical protein